MCKNNIKKLEKGVIDMIYLAKCPLCGNVLNFGMEYHFGTPFVFWYCDCGYTTKYDKIQYSTNTDYSK